MVVLGTGWVAAHDGGELALDVPVERVAAGGELPIVGADWGPSEALEVRLQQGGQVTTLGSIRTDEEGHFATTIALPDTLPPGPVAIEVVAGTGVRARDIVTIEAAAAPSRAAAQPGSSPAGAGATADVGLGSIVAVGIAVAALLVVLLRRRPAPKRAPD